MLHTLTTPPMPLSLPPFGTAQSSDMVASPRKSPIKKPKRPLTAYHIYFQIEREFIIQTMAGEDADKSIHEGKALFHDVPKRYINTKLSPDWYFGPGKRAKRKHRKQHGKIGFLELSRVITSRWTKLEDTDPDIKQFVSKLAMQELEEYKRELKEYRVNLTKNMITPVVVSNRSSSMKQQPAPQVQQQVAMMMPQYQMMDYQQTPQGTSSLPFHGAKQPCEDKSLMKTPFELRQESDRLKNELEYATTYQQRTFMWGERQPDDELVDVCDDEILSMWKTSNAD